MDESPVMEEMEEVASVHLSPKSKVGDESNGKSPIVNSSAARNVNSFTVLNEVSKKDEEFVVAESSNSELVQQKNKKKCVEVPALRKRKLSKNWGGVVYINIKD